MAALSGQHAVVTGAGRGIGAAIARALLAEGASVSLLGRDQARLAASAMNLGGVTQTVAIDVADENSVRAAFATIRERFPRIDILINNAGQAESAPLAKTSTELWQRMLAVNLTGTFYCCREVVGAMVKQFEMVSKLTKSMANMSAADRVKAVKGMGKEGVMHSVETQSSQNANGSMVSKNQI